MWCVRSVLAVCRPPEGGVAAGGGASDPGGDVGGGGAEGLPRVSVGGTTTAGTTGRPGPGGGHDDPRTGTQLVLNLEGSLQALTGLQ